MHEKSIKPRRSCDSLQIFYLVLCLEQQLTMEKISLGRKLERETQDLRGSTNCLRPREREWLLLLYIIGLQYLTIYTNPIQYKIQEK